MIIKDSVFRRDFYRLLDRVLEEGMSIEIERNGRLLRVVSLDALPKLDRLVPHPDMLVGDPEDFVHMDWSEEIGWMK